MTDQEVLTEIRDRVRRIETRVTITGRHVGADVGGGKPKWYDNGNIDVPTPNVSLSELMKVIPTGWDKGFNVYVNSDYLFSGTIIPQ